MSAEEPRWIPSEKFSSALTFAVGLHAHQSRRNPQRDPYLTHLLAVASLVVEDGGSEEDAIAALLHDAVEDHPVKSPSGGRVRRLKQIRSDFGSYVARIVEGCTDTLADEKPDRRERKVAYIARLRREAADVRRVSLCDKLHNARCLVADLEHGVGFDRFNGWYYGELRRAFDDSATVSRYMREFRRLVEVIEQHGTSGDGASA